MVIVLANGDSCSPASPRLYPGWHTYRCRFHRFRESRYPQTRCRDPGETGVALPYNLTQQSVSGRDTTRSNDNGDENGKRTLTFVLRSRRASSAASLDRVAGGAVESPRPCLLSWHRPLKHKVNRPSVNHLASSPANLGGRAVVCVGDAMKWSPWVGMRAVISQTIAIVEVDRDLPRGRVGGPRMPKSALLRSVDR